MQYARYEPRIIQYDTPYEDVEMRKWRCNKCSNYVKYNLEF